VDNSEALPNNYFAYSKIVFEYRENGNYNDLIMLMLNDLMGIVDSED
jgi:phage I-like protein